jgi:Protein of unknown function (DUF3667)
MSTTADTVARACASCGEALHGPYCASCGEEVIDPRKLSVRYFLGHTLVSELLSVDSKIWRSLVLLLFRPGFLSLEYSAGRRVPYVHPVRVLITAILAYALGTLSGQGFTLNLGSITLSLVPAAVPAGRAIEETLRQADRFDLIARSLRASFGVPLADIPSDQVDRFNGTLANLATPLSFTVVLLLALMLYLLFRRRRPLLVEHLVFAIHFFSFVLFCWTFLALATTLGILSGPVIVLVMLGIIFWQVGYLATATRRFYMVTQRGVVPRVAAVGVALALYLLSCVFVTGVQVLSGVAAAWLL